MKRENLDGLLTFSCESLKQVQVKSWTISTKLCFLKAPYFGKCCSSTFESSWDFSFSVSCLDNPYPTLLHSFLLSFLSNRQVLGQELANVSQGMPSTCSHGRVIYLFVCLTLFYVPVIALGRGNLCSGVELPEHSGEFWIRQHSFLHRLVSELSFH